MNPKFSRMLRAGGLVLVIAVSQAAAARAQDLSDETLTKLLQAAPNPDTAGTADIEIVNAQRQAALVKQFKQVGATPKLLPVVPIDPQGTPELPIPNVAVTLPGQHEDRLIVLGAHLDQVPKQPWQTGNPHGVIDDWSGAALLVKLYEHLQQHGPFYHTFVLVGFAYEESNLLGSQSYVEQMRNAGRLRDIKAMVNFECLGVSDLFTWENGSTDWLEELAEEVDRELPQVVLTRRELQNVGADSVPFIRAGRPAITIDSLGPGDFSKIHSPEDKFANVDLDKFRGAFEFAARYLKALDKRLELSPGHADFFEPGPASPTGFAASQQLKLTHWHPSDASLAKPDAFQTPSKHTARRSDLEVDFEQAIGIANADWLEFARQGDAARLARLYADDAVIVPPDAPVRQGREQIEKYYAEHFAKLPSIDTTFDSRSLLVSGGLAYETGAYGNGYESFVVWQLALEGGRIVARFQFDAWRPPDAAAGAGQPATETGYVGGTLPPAPAVGAIRVAEGIVALQDSNGWILVEVKDGRARATRLDELLKPAAAIDH